VPVSGKKTSGSADLHAAALIHGSSSTITDGSDSSLAQIERPLIGSTPGIPPSTRGRQGRQGRQAFSFYSPRAWVEEGGLPVLPGVPA
jgi:hypothetical protein